jgi:hypothetical protein
VAAATIVHACMYSSRHILSFGSFVCRVSMGDRSECKRIEIVSGTVITIHGEWHSQSTLSIQRPLPPRGQMIAHRSWPSMALIKRTWWWQGQTLFEE